VDFDTELFIENQCQNPRLSQHGLNIDGCIKLLVFVLLLYNRFAGICDNYFVSSCFIGQRLSGYMCTSLKKTTSLKWTPKAQRQKECGITNSLS